MKEFGITVLIFIVIASIYYIGCYHGKTEHPTAMDVYQNKTTLKYTIVDGIKTDSIVVMKNE